MNEIKKFSSVDPDAVIHPRKVAGNTMKAVQFYSPYGYRAKLGLIVPSTNTVMEPEYYLMAPKGVSIHTARMLLLGKATEESYFAMESDTARAATELGTAEVDVIGWGCTSGSVICPSEKIAKVIEDTAHIQAVTTIGAVHAALTALGAKKISLGTPYVDFVNQAEVKFLEDNGFQVLRWYGLELGESQEERRGIGRVPPESLERFVRFIDEPDSDCIFLSCTNLATVEMIDTLEQAVGKPVISSNQATFWQSLRTTGLKDSIEGFGSLLREY